MAKNNRIALSRMVAQETFDSVKSLAGKLGCSEGEVVDRAVRQLLEDETPGQVQEVPLELREHVRETLERVKALPELAEIGTLLGHLIEPLKTSLTTSTPARMPPPSVGAHAINCRHCGNPGFGTTRYATVCSECKSVGHTSPPEECPRCTEGKAI